MPLNRRALSCLVASLLFPVFAHAGVDPVGRPSSSQPNASIQMTALPLPDDGPRFPATNRGPEVFLFDEAVRAYRAGQFASAEQTFRRMLDEFPGTGLRSAVRAFLAEIIAKDGTDHHRRQAVEQYRLLVHDDPQSANAARARWRIADLYAEAGWRVEARAAYEHAARGADWDTARAWLGLGHLFLTHGEPSGAEMAFRRVRALSDDGRLLAPAIFGLADALAIQQRRADALTAYEEGVRTWPQVFRVRPWSILSYADIAERVNASRGRALYLLFRNLYPDHPLASSTVIKIGDSWRREFAYETARKIYGTVLVDYPGSPAEAHARMRLTELRGERSIRDQAESLRWRIAQDFDLAPPLPLNVSDQAEMFRSIVARYPTETLGSEALYHLGELFEANDQLLDAVQAYRELSDRRGHIPEDPWPDAAGRRLRLLLQPWMTAALQSHDDFVVLTLFYRHGRYAEDLYAATDVLLGVADAHRRAGFLTEAVKLYQALLHRAADDELHQGALLGLGRAYLAQSDVPAARRVFERLLLQYPLSDGRVEALSALATTLDRLEDDDGVIRVCRRWLRLVRDANHPERPLVLALLARAQSRAGKPREALETYGEAAKHGALSAPSVRLRYADSLHAAGRLGDALAQYQAVAGTGMPHETEWSVIRMVQLTAAQQRYREAQELIRHAREATEAFAGRVGEVFTTRLESGQGSGG